MSSVAYIPTYEGNVVVLRPVPTTPAPGGTAVRIPAATAPAPGYVPIPTRPTPAPVTAPTRHPLQRLVLPVVSPLRDQSRCNFVPRGDNPFKNDGSTNSNS